MNEKRTVGPVTTSATVGFAVAMVTAWAIKTAFGIEMPEPVVGALALIIGAIGTVVGGFLAKPTGKRAAR